MGGGYWTSAESRALYHTMSTTVKEKAATFGGYQHALANEVDATMLAHNITGRESRDSEDHPESWLIALLFDDTGSMGSVPGQWVEGPLGALMDTLYECGIKDPQLIAGCIGDCDTDKYPLQIGQAESDHRAAEWITKLFIEGNGGPYGAESYVEAALWMRERMSMDCFEKRQRKALLITVGDEMGKVATPERMARLGIKLQADMKEADVVTYVRERFNWIHIFCGDDERAFSYWNKLLGQNVFRLGTEDIGNMIASIALKVADDDGVERVEYVKPETDSTGDVEVTL